MEGLGFGTVFGAFLYLLGLGQGLPRVPARASASLRDTIHTIYPLVDIVNTV
jgi:hypothetical protein